MFLSKISFNPKIVDAYVYRSLSSPYEMHRMICRAFPTSNLESVLFRDQIDQDNPFVLVQSKQKPDWNFLEEKNIEVAMKEVNYNFQQDQRLFFQLRANPVTSKRKEDSRRYKSPLLQPQEQASWLAQRGKQHGYSLFRTTIKKSCALKFYRKKDFVIQNCVDFEGILTVTDCNLFRESLENGIGPAKFSGMGMMCTLPVKMDND